MCASDDGRCLAGDVDLLHQLRWVPARSRRQAFRIMLHGIKLIEPGGQALRGTPRVHEHERGAMLHDFAVKVFFNKRPNGFRGGQCRISHRRGASNAQWIIHCHLTDSGALLWGGQIRHVFHRHVDIKLPAFFNRRCHDFHGPVAAQKIRHCRKRAHRCR